MSATPLKTILMAGAAGLALAGLTACGGSNETEAQTTEPSAKPLVVTDAEASANEEFDRFIEDATTKLLRANPSIASELNVSVERAGGRYKDRFAAPGIEGYLERRTLQEQIDNRLAEFDSEELSGERQEYLAILLANEEAEDTLYQTADDAGYYLAGRYSSPYVVTQIGGVHVDLPQFMTQAHTLETRDDAVAYITRLNLFDEQFAGAIELIDANAEAGAIPPDYALQGAINNAQGFIEVPAEENVLVTHLTDYLDTVEFENEEELVEDVMDAVRNSVYPAYENLVASLTELETRATHEAGIWDIPQGAELYNALIKVNGESELSGDAVHEQGLAEVARIQAEMEELFEKIDMTEGSVGERLAKLTEDPDQLYPDTPEGKQQLLAYVRELAANAEEVMDDYFLQVPSIGVEVHPVPEYAQEGAPGGYYMSPAEDGSRPGMYFINLRTTAAQPKFSLPTLTYHEAVPGHHFQLALATDAKDTPLLVRMNASSTGFAEGWALYSENFAEEIGLYKDDPYGDIGRLRDELFRAVRLVVDSGMHAKKWSREEAIAYMVANAGMERSGVASEIERYSVWPAQALAYKTGMLKIQELRQRAEEALGEDFDVAAFHYEVLRGGGAPLTVLEDRIDRWIEAGGPEPDLG